MSTVNEHYERLLSKHYTWMFGTSFDEKSERTKIISFPNAGASHKHSQSLPSRWTWDADLASRP